MRHPTALKLTRVIIHLSTQHTSHNLKVEIFLKKKNGFQITKKTLVVIVWLGWPVSSYNLQIWIFWIFCWTFTRSNIFHLEQSALSPIWEFPANFWFYWYYVRCECLENYLLEKQDGDWILSLNVYRYWEKLFLYFFIFFLSGWCFLQTSLWLDVGKNLKIIKVERKESLGSHLSSFSYINFSFVSRKLFIYQIKVKKINNI